MGLHGKEGRRGDMGGEIWGSMERREEGDPWEGKGAAIRGERGRHWRGKGGAIGG
jgi:hypothetical protein